MTFDDWKWKLTFQDLLQMVLLPNRKPSLEVCSSGWILGMLSAVDCISGKFGLVNYSQIHPDSWSCLLLSCFFHVESKIWGTFRQKEILIKWWFHCLVNQWNCCFTKRKSTTHFGYFFRVLYQNLTIEQLVNVLSIEWGDTRNCCSTWIWWEGLEKISRNRSICFAVRLKSHIFCHSWCLHLREYSRPRGKIWNTHLEAEHGDPQIPWRFRNWNSSGFIFLWTFIYQLVIFWNLTFPANKKAIRESVRVVESLVISHRGSPVVKISPPQRHCRVEKSPHQSTAGPSEQSPGECRRFCLRTGPP